MIYVKDQGVWKEVGGRTLVAPGDPFGGGFYIGNYNGHHYIVSDKSAEASLRWKTIASTTPGASSETDGWANTNAMDSATHPAAQHCKNYGGGGYDDWFLPARNELNLFWINIAPGNPSTHNDFKTGGAQALATPDRYWSSTQGGTSSIAWTQEFVNGNQTSNFMNKTNSLFVRPVRKIPI